MRSRRVWSRSRYHLIVRSVLQIDIPPEYGSRPAIDPRLMMNYLVRMDERGEEVHTPEFCFLNSRTNSWVR